MSYKNDSNLVIANRFGDASSAAKAQLWETYDRLRDLTVSGSGTGTGFESAGGLLYNLASLLAPSSLSYTVASSYTVYSSLELIPLKSGIISTYTSTIFPVGLSLNETRSYVKCYMGDTGLLVSHAFDENELLEDEVYKQILAGKLQINEGMLYENAIAQMLVANGHKLYFYTHYNENKHRNDMEIDFIISNNSRLKYKMFPIEVKSGKQYKTTSLNNFREKYKERIGESYIIHPRNLIVKDGIICIPPYMTMNI